MSLRIDPMNVVAILLPGVGWVKGDGRGSFALDSYEFMYEFVDEKPFILLGGGDERAAGVSALGFWIATSDGRTLVGPVSAIQAVQLKYEDNR